MPKHIKFTNEAWSKLQEGINTVANAVKITLGSDGKYAVLEREWGGPIITNDGVTIAKDIDLTDAYAELGARLVKEVAHKTNEEAGDGTTTAIILTQALFNSGIELVKKGINRSRLRKGIKLATENIVQQLKKLATKIESLSQLTQIATLSASGDKEVGALIAQAIHKVGVEGAVLVEDSKIGKTELEFIEGYKLPSGVVSPYMIFDQSKQKTELDNPLVLVTDRMLSGVNDFARVADVFQKALEHYNIPTRTVAIEGGRQVTVCDTPLVIFADDVTRAMLAGMIRNNMAGLIRWVGVKNPATLDKKEILSDIALKTGGKLLAREGGENMDTLTVEHFGRCKKAIIDHNNTILVGGAGNQEEVDKRVAELSIAVKNKAEDGFNLDRLKTRLSNLSNNVAILRVGAATATELTEKLFRVEDAINSAKAALEEGIVAGAGTALYYISQNKPKCMVTNEDEKKGYDLIYDVIQYPAKQILINADMDLRLLKNIKFPYLGFNTETREQENLIETGIIDPVKVTRCALEYATSTIGTLLLSDVIVVKNEERENKTLTDAQGRMI